jgi:quinol monooxygenase YgiN
MITEIVLLVIDPARAREFEAAVAAAAPQFRSAVGCHGMSLEHIVEDPARYRLVVLWDSVEHHTKLFRQSDNFLKWRELAGPYFLQPPEVTHSRQVGKYF